MCCLSRRRQAPYRDFAGERQLRKSNDLKYLKPSLLPHARLRLLDCCFKRRVVPAERGGRHPRGHVVRLGAPRGRVQLHDGLHLGGPRPPLAPGARPYDRGGLGPSRWPGNLRSVIIATVITPPAAAAATTDPPSYTDPEPCEAGHRAHQQARQRRPSEQRGCVERVVCPGRRRLL